MIRAYGMKKNPRPRYIVDFTFSDEEEEKNLRHQSCHQQGCSETGTHRAPAFRDSPHYLWFCLEHVKQYNQEWDYYKGMKSWEIESHRKADVTWQRPTWPLGQGTTKEFLKARCRGYDFFSCVHEKDPTTPGACLQTPPLNQKEIKALILFDLKWPLHKDTLKTRYKQLAKRYHPDMNPQDPCAEEHLKDIIHAYTLLKNLVSQGS